jgi:phosphohistidine phosphatase SixA
MMLRGLLFLITLLLPFSAAQAEEAAWNLLKEDGAIVLFRHANAPGTGDPANFVLGDCSTQRNLDERGRTQSRAIGEAFRQRGIAVGRVLSSQWCRTLETAELAFPGQVKEEPGFNSFFGDRSSEPQATARAREVLSLWSGPGVLVVVTHQVNIQALTGVAPRSGEGIVVSPGPDGLAVRGRLPPPAVGD